MKGLVTTISALAVAAAFAEGTGVTSENIVGFTTTNSVSDNNFRCVTFANIGFTTADIQQIAISDGGQGSIGWGEETFGIWEGLPSVVAGSSFIYYDAVSDPNGEATGYYWGDDSGNPISYGIAPGQGVVLGLNSDLAINVSGEVPTDDVSFVSVGDNNFTGNPYPTDIDIQRIAISDGGQGGIGWGEETFGIWEGLPSVVPGSSFIYYDPVSDPNGEATGYYWGDDVGNPVSYAISPGQGVVLGLSAGLTVTITCPYTL